MVFLRWIVIFLCVNTKIRFVKIKLRIFLFRRLRYVQPQYTAMKALPIALVLCLALSSCYTPKGLHTQLKAAPVQPVFDFMVLFVPVEEDIYKLDQEAYDLLIRGNFNDLQHKNFRSHIHRSFSKTFKDTFVHDYQNFFEDHHPYSYEEFMGRLKEDGVNHILLITLKAEDKTVRPVVTRDFVLPVNYTDRQYQLYLFDLEQQQPLWLSYGYMTITGGFSGIRTTTNELARGAAKELKKGDLLYASLLKR